MPVDALFGELRFAERRLIAAEERVAFCRATAAKTSVPVQHGHGFFCQRNRANDTAFAEKCCSRSRCAEPQIRKMQLQQLANPGAGVIQDGEHGLVSAAFGSGHIGCCKDGPGCVFSQVFHLGKRIILLCLDSGYIQRCCNVFRTAGRSVGNECAQGGEPVISCGTSAVLLCLQVIQISIERICIHHIKCDSSQFCSIPFCQIGEELVQRLSVICNGAWTGLALCRKIYAKPVLNQHEQAFVRRLLQSCHSSTPGRMSPISSQFMPLALTRCSGKRWI